MLSNPIKDITVTFEYNIFKKQLVRFMKQHAPTKATYKINNDKSKEGRTIAVVDSWKLIYRCAAV